MTGETKAPERIWLGRDNRYVGSPWLRLASDFEDEEEDGEVQEYVRADLFEASAAMASRQNAPIDTLRDELAKEKAKSARLVEALAPFASCADELDYDAKETGRAYPDDEWAKFRLLVVHYRDARAAIATYEVKT